MLIDYSGTKTFEATLVVDDPGNCAVKAEGYYPVAKGIKMPGTYYLIIKTVMGTTKVLKWGAIADPDGELPNGFDLNFKSFQYKEASILRELSLFLNDGTKAIYDAEVITIDDALNALPQDYNYVSTLD